MLNPCFKNSQAFPSWAAESHRQPCVASSHDFSPSPDAPITQQLHTFPRHTLYGHSSFARSVPSAHNAVPVLPDRLCDSSSWTHAPAGNIPQVLKRLLELNWMELASFQLPQPPTSVKATQPPWTSITSSVRWAPWCLPHKVFMRNKEHQVVAT